MVKIVLSETTKINDIVKEYPFLKEVLTELDPKLKRLQNPILSKTVGRKATLTDVAQLINLDLNQVIDFLAKKIEKHSSAKIPIKIGAQETSGWKDKKSRKRELLKALVLELHDGGELNTLKERFEEIVGDVEATEIASMEQELIDSGELTVEQITLLCDLHVGIFEDALSLNLLPETTPGHPIHTYTAENKVAKEIIAEIRKHPSKSLIKKLSKIIIHYTRLENQLFPLLEQKDFSGPAQVMWSKHDEVRDLFRMREQVDAEEIVKQVEDMIFKEENILLPTSLELLTISDWLVVKRGEEEIGFAWITPGDEWKPITPETIHATDISTEKPDKLDLNTGKLTLPQIDLMLTHLPVEISFIDEKDEVAYYSGTKERIFPRSPGVIGRNVLKCHPPRSLDKVNQILEAFKSGKKDHADFWIEMGRKFLYIRYFAVRDEKGVYIGTLEVTQDLTTIRTLQGEQKLIDWENT
ncbi:MAG: DUF438 domain-containing protein [Candidatus Hodarchaeales archaeon]